MSTKLLYMEDMQALTCDAYVTRSERKDDKQVVYLDQTVFYPQGGGQPFDTGVIATDYTKFVVEEVRYADGEVLHIGHYEGQPFMQGEDVTCAINEERRRLNTRLHSGGHLLDMAVNELGYSWIPGKGYHFPDGPYVEYQADLGEETHEAVTEKLNRQMADILTRGIQTEIRFMPKEEMSTYCRHVPEYLPAGKPSRIVLYGEFGVPCGGTHVAKLADIGSVTIRKIKGQTGTIRVSYEIQ
ncbi:MAG: alanine--tRNA ligase-related protein [Candidatus Saccharibacteria bacterium]|nr:alanine--tRNA ligase-related protein [Candidatus Saccharibacteria bacterium]